MNLIRLIVLGVLFYILYRLILGTFKTKAPAPPKTDRIQDVLREDPICHTYVPESQAVVLKRRDGVVHFCSEKCRDEFLEQQKKNDAAQSKEQ